MGAGHVVVDQANYLKQVAQAAKTVSDKRSDQLVRTFESTTERIKNDVAQELAKTLGVVEMTLALDNHSFKSNVEYAKGV